MFRKFLKALPKQDGKSDLDWQNYYLDKTIHLWGEHEKELLNELVSPVPDLFRQVAKEKIAGKIGEIALITEADKVIISSGVEKIRLNKKGYEKGLTPEYLFAIMCCEKIGKYTADRYTVTASTIPHFKEDFIRKMVVPILDSESINIITEKIKEAFSLLNKKKGLVLECQNQINSIIKI